MVPQTFQLIEGENQGLVVGRENSDGPNSAQGLVFPLLLRRGIARIIIEVDPGSWQTQIPRLGFVHILTCQPV